MRAVLVALLVSCAPPAMTMTAEHPANPDAPAGRLAGPPAALRPGVADLSNPSLTRGEVQHEHGATPASESPAAQPSTTPLPARPAVEKPDPTKPVEKPRKQDRPAASKPVPGKADKPQKPQKPPPAHQGHEGHH